MSWSFGNAGNAAGAGAATGAAAGPALEEIQTDALGFLTLAGETKARILPQAWPSDMLPPPTANLLSVCSPKGLLAAAGPNVLVIASTDAVRAAYNSGAAEQAGGKPVETIASLEIPRVSQVAFSCDGSCLVIAAEQGGGMAIYDVQALQQGQTQSAFQLGTNSFPIRALVPNPAPEYSHLFAVVLVGGQLLLADLKDRKLLTGSGSCFRDGVSCVSWSAKGKQLVAGLEDGTSAQYDHQGAQKATIPRPPQLQGPVPVTGTVWLANDDFFTIHSPPDTIGSDATYYITHRDKTSGAFTSSKFVSDPVPSFGNRHPAHHFIARLKSFPPSLDDTLIVTSTAGADVGVFTKSSMPLANDLPAEQVTNTYTVTMMAQDSRRAQLPMSADGTGDTSPLGVAIDLSSKDLVKRPLPSDGEIEQSAAPLPAYIILNNEGLLISWWVVYTESIRQRTAYSGLTNVPGQSFNAGMSTSSQAAPSPAPVSAPPAQSTPAFGTSTFGPVRPTFGSATTPGFGGASALGNKASPWGTPGQAATTFGQPAFGASTTTSFGGAASTGSSAFGAANPLGSKQSPWASGSGSAQTGGATFGQTTSFGVAAKAPSGFAAFSSSNDGNSASGGQASSASPFGNFSSGDGQGSSPFANTGSSTSASPFAAFGSGGVEKKTSPFATFGQTSKTGESSFGSTVTLPSTNAGSFGQPSTGFSFGKPSTLPPSGLSREATMTDEDGATAPAEAGAKQNQSGLGGFKLVSGFQGDGTAKDDLPAPKNPGGSLFGNSFGNLLNGSAKKHEGQQEATKPAPPSFSFGTKPAEKPAEKPAAKPAAPEDAPLPPDFIKKEPIENESLNDIPLPPDPAPSRSLPEDAPLPPMPSSKDRAALKAAPLPFDFTKAVKSTEDEQDLPPIAGSPPLVVGNGGSSDLSPTGSDDEHDDEEDGEDDEVEEEEDDEEEEFDGSDEEQEDWEDESADPEDGYDEVETPQVTQQSITQAASTPFGSRLSFGTKAADSRGDQAKSLFPSTTPAGLPKGPIFAPPSKESPRSPSPIRSISTPAGKPFDRQVQREPQQLQARPQAITSAKPTTNVRSSKQVARPEPESATLSDEEDTRIRAILDSDVRPTKILEPFTAHQDYVGIGNKPGIGGQIENVYRDVNSMIDTLGLNARSLQAFVQGHEEYRRQNGRTTDDLEQDGEWCLVEVEDLSKLENGVEKDIEKQKLEDATNLLDKVSSLKSDTLRVRLRTQELRRQLALHADPEKRAAQRNAPLDTDAEIQQNRLRQTMAAVQRLVQAAEEQLSILRAELASNPASDGRAGPTVEAVTNTIMKMTAMIEQKSGDVDVLEAQIRRLPQGVAGLSLEDGDETDMLRSSTTSFRSSRRGLPVSRSTNALATPAGLRQSLAMNRRSLLGAEKLGMSGMLGSRFRTPPQADCRRSLILQSSSPDGSVLGRSPRRRKMADVSSAEVEAYLARVQHRKKVLAALQDVVEKKGTRKVEVGS